MSKTLNEWRDACGEYAKAKGWDDEPRSFGDWCALFHTEISEAYEAYRDGHALTEVWYNRDRAVYNERHEMLPKPEGIPIELIDLIYRILHFAAVNNINMDAYMELKHMYNTHREYRHGGKVA